MPEYHLQLPDGARARGAEPSLSFRASGGPALARELEDALRSPALFERWRAMQPDPDEVDAALGATGCQPYASGPTGAPPRQGRSVDALRPACASCTAGTVPCVLRNPVIRRNASTWVSFQRPRSYGEIRPSGATAVASTMIRPVPPVARAA